ncbi:Uncharacterized protein GBIM_09917 [Gryllus bimaculatus]|nr:Uncharacterized protein GBIM_09917 [Gryllus bimaculatus]
MAVKEKIENISDEIEWNVDAEVQLFYAMHGHKPVGVNKYFQMVCILEKFKNAINNKDNITSKVIWDHLDTMYDLQALDDTENLPFPNEEREFSLPLAEFASLMEEKRKSLEAGHGSVSEIKREVVKKETIDKKEGMVKEVKNIALKKEVKDIPKEIKKEPKEIKEPKKIAPKEVKEVRRESKDKEAKKEFKRESKELPKEIKKDVTEIQDQKVIKPRVSLKEKKEAKKDEDFEDVSLATLTARKERVKEVTDTKTEDSPKRGGKRPTRGSLKPDDAGSNKSASPVITATPPPMKRRRT